MAYSENRWVVVHGSYNQWDWDEIYDWLNYKGCDNWFAVADGQFTLRPDLGSGTTTGTLMFRGFAEYGNTPDDLIRALSDCPLKNGNVGISAERVDV